jgi:hypothetical protein
MTDQITKEKTIKVASCCMEIVPDKKNKIYYCTLCNKNTTVIEATNKEIANHWN